MFVARSEWKDFINFDLRRSVALQHFAVVRAKSAFSARWPCGKSNPLETMDVVEPHIVQIKLLPARSADERKRNIIANIVVEGHAGSVPYIDDIDSNANATSIVKVTQLNVEKQNDRRKLRYFAVGPSTYKIKCPLCRQYGDGAVMRTAGLKDITCCLSLLSGAFPIFWLCCLYTWCGCTRQWTTKGLYCSNCGGKLGVQRKVK